MSGYILESKSILESDIWHKPALYFKVWHYLLLRAQYQPNGNLGRGQLFTSISEIAEACSYFVGYRKITPTKKEIWSVLEYLRNPYERNYERNDKGTMIETTKVTHGIVVTICNYNKYQDPKAYESNGESNDEIRTKEQRSGQQGNNIINELNEYNKENKEKIPTVSKRKRESQERNQIPPTVEMIQTYCNERHNTVDAEKFYDFYESKNWYIGKNKMRDWQAAVRTWERKDDHKDAVIKTVHDLQDISQGMTQDEYDALERTFR